MNLKWTTSCHERICWILTRLWSTLRGECDRDCGWCQHAAEQCGSAGSSSSHNSFKGYGLPARDRPADILAGLMYGSEEQRLVTMFWLVFIFDFLKFYEKYLGHFIAGWRSLELSPQQPCWLFLVCLLITFHIFISLLNFDYAWG